MHGDYDVDGVTSTALLVGTLNRLGGRTAFFVPRRDLDGYGFSRRAVAEARTAGASLIVTVDCGSSDAATVAEARTAGIDVIVTDHHEVPAGAAGQVDCVAFVNPKRPDSQYGFRELAGVGVAFKVAWSLLAARGGSKDDLGWLLDLVGLGTIADVVPLTDENRILARLGLSALRASRRPGVRALLAVAGITGRQLTTRQISFALAPRINAAGRVGDAARAVRLLLTNNNDEAELIAAELSDMNRARQRLEEKTLGEALAAFERQNEHGSRTLVVTGAGWHEGVLGIVAAKLTDRLGRPTFVVSLQDGRGRGSGRSVPGFDLHTALSACATHLVGFGGHRYAAGLTVLPDAVDAFRSALSRHAAALPTELFEPTLHVDCIAPLAAIDQPLFETISRFEPFGPDNPQPLLAAAGVQLASPPRAIGRDHLALRLRAGSRTLDAVAWGRGCDAAALTAGGQLPLDICFAVEQRTWQGRTSLRLTLRDLRVSQPVAG